jgi:xylitol oxidase
MGFTPSSGEELQSEYLFPRRHAVEAIEAVCTLAEGIEPILQVSEIRAVAADRLWMSMSYGEDTVGIHFTWKPEREPVEEMIVRLEAALAPFGARPHWGKLFAAEAPRSTSECRTSSASSSGSTRAGRSATRG